MSEYPDSCVYWIHLPEHTDMFTQGYVGVSVYGAKERFKSHLKETKLGSNLIIHNAIRKHGEQIVVDTIVKGDPEYCLEIEYKLRPSPKIGWNIGTGGSKTQLGMKHSEETRKKISEKGFGRECSDETRQKMSSSRKGKKLSESHAKAVKEAAKGRVFTEDAKLKAKEANSKRMRGCTWDNSAAVAKLKSLFMWEKPNSKPENWLKAKDIYLFVKDYPDFGDTKISKEFGIPRTQLRTILSKIKQGWNPLEDNDWLIFSSKVLTPDNLEIS